MRLREDIDLLQKLLKFHDRVSKPDAVMNDAEAYATGLADELKRAAQRVTEFKLVDDEARILMRCCRRMIWARLDRNEDQFKRWKHLAERPYCAVAGDVVNALKVEGAP
jgi:hypothetical protein